MHTHQNPKKLLLLKAPSMQFSILIALQCILGVFALFLTNLPSWAMLLITFILAYFFLSSMRLTYLKSPRSIQALSLLEDQSQGCKIHYQDGREEVAFIQKESITIEWGIFLHFKNEKKQKKTNLLLAQQFQCERDFHQLLLLVKLG